MLVAGFARVLRSHLQFRAALDNAVIRSERQKSSLKLNNVFVTVLRGTDCPEPRWSLDLESFGGVLAADNWKITSAILPSPENALLPGSVCMKNRIDFRGNHRFVYSTFWEERAPGISPNRLFG